eukprot:SAG31_NODE_20327_length_577_cov_1.433054_2_plen_82_part_00
MLRFAAGMAASAACSGQRYILAGFLAYRRTDGGGGGGGGEAPAADIHPRTGSLSLGKAAEPQPQPEAEPEPDGIRLHQMMR